MRKIDLERFGAWARIIERDTRTNDLEKASLKLKAWSVVASNKNFLSLLVELGRVY